LVPLSIAPFQVRDVIVRRIEVEVVDVGKTERIRNEGDRNKAVYGELLFLVVPPQADHVVSE
jgi:hypothetical protein